MVMDCVFPSSLPSERPREINTTIVGEHVFTTVTFPLRGIRRSFATHLLTGCVLRVRHYSLTVLCS